MDIHNATFEIAERAVEEREAQHIRIMAGQRARDGDIVEPMGMDVAAYLRNPVVLWAHDHGGVFSGAAGGLPIARTTRLYPSAQGIEADFEFVEGDPFADRVRNAWEQGFIRSASIAWRTLAWEPLPDDVAAGQGGRGRRHTRTELIEWSLVPVPADVGASRAGYAEAMLGLGIQPVEDDRLRRFFASAGALAEAVRKAGRGSVDNLTRPADRPPSPTRIRRGLRE